MLLILGILLFIDGLGSLIICKEHKPGLDAGRGIRIGLGIIIALYWLKVITFIF